MDRHWPKNSNYSSLLLLSGNKSNQKCLRANPLPSSNNNESHEVGKGIIHCSWRYVLDSPFTPRGAQTSSVSNVGSLYVCLYYFLFVQIFIWNIQFFVIKTCANYWIINTGSIFIFHPWPLLLCIFVERSTSLKWTWTGRRRHRWKGKTSWGSENRWSPNLFAIGDVLQPLA